MYHYFNGKLVTTEEDKRYLKVVSYPLDKFIRKVCDYEYEGKLSEEEANEVIKVFKKFKKDGKIYKEQKERTEEIIKEFINEK